MIRNRIDGEERDMLYTELTCRAMCIAHDAHDGQRDQSGVPYIFHPMHVAERMGDDEYAICVALLHDVVEDADWTLERLSRLFPDAVVQAVALLTHDPAVPYGTYLRPIRKNPLARKVKLADLEHNSDFSRLCTASRRWTEQEIEAHRAKYARARAFLLGED